MSSDPAIIHWRMHLQSSPISVHQLLSSNEGRARFWAESAIAGEDGEIIFVFSNGSRLIGKVLENTPPSRFVLNYWGGSKVTFNLVNDGLGGTDLELTDEEVPVEWRTETSAGWVSVLLALKAAVDFSIDLRNHDPFRSWDQGFVDN